MSNAASRTFDDRPAVRERTPLLLGMVGPSGTGKTYSSLRIATGIQKVCGGDIFVIDTEARRALHYADKFVFRHVPFGAPFSPLDYLAAIEHCVKKGAKTIVIDSMSHEHEGPGGVLEMHAAEVFRRAGTDWQKAERVKMIAWAEPKAQRRRLINTMLQLDCNFILNFRAKQKLKIVKKEEPVQLGYMPIAGEEYVYEMVMKFLLLPGARGVPVFKSEHEGERAMIKIPDQFEHMFREQRQLTEELGAQMATWAAGSAASSGVSVGELVARYEACSDHATLRVLEDQRGKVWDKASKADKAALKRATDDARQRIADAESAAPPAVDGVERDPLTGEVVPPDVGAGREPGSDDAP